MVAGREAVPEGSAAAAGKTPATAPARRLPAGHQALRGGLRLLHLLDRLYRRGQRFLRLLRRAAACAAPACAAAAAALTAVLAPPAHLLHRINRITGRGLGWLASIPDPYVLADIDDGPGRGLPYR